jgi:DNA (cytosine-5)-methyltransferase 1
MSSLKVGSLFAGIGGFDLGLTWAGGYEIAWQVELDQWCRRVLQKHWPDAERGSIEFSDRFPKSGMMRSGVLYPLTMSERPTSGNASGLWPTPRVCGNYNRKGASATSMDGLATAVKKDRWPTPTAMTGGEQVAPSHVDGTHGWNIGAAVQDSMSQTPHKKWPTPTVQDSENDAGPSQWKRDTSPLNVEVHRRNGKTATTKTGQLNPTWVEWLMGYPEGWTVLED